MTDDEIAEAVVQALGDGVKCPYCGHYVDRRVSDQYHLLANAWVQGEDEPRPYVTACMSPNNKKRRRWW